MGEIVASLGLEQLSVSKDLRVLRDVGLVHARREGRRMPYRTNADGIRPLHEWARNLRTFLEESVATRSKKRRGAVGKSPARRKFKEES